MMNDSELLELVNTAINESDNDFDLDGNKLKKLEHLIISIWMRLDIQIDLRGVRYYIGVPNGELLISWDNGENEIIFENEDIAALLQHEINGMKIKDVWEEIEIYAM